MPPTAENQDRLFPPAPGPGQPARPAVDFPILGQAASGPTRDDKPCCGPPIKPRPPRDPFGQHFVLGRVDTPAGPAPRVDWAWTARDQLETIKVRWAIGRMNYVVEPGLYALGDPDQDSPVLVSANFKLSFDRLRRAMAGHSAWLLVLETFGINVWCAAGKGTFGTAELADRVTQSRLAGVVAHRELIVPQLGAPGVAAHLVKRQTGFKVVYGPVRAEDLPAFLAAGKKATPAMRRKDFPTWDRVVLSPIELVAALKHYLYAAPALFLLAGLLFTGAFWAAGVNHGLFAAAALLAGIGAGVFLTPLLLPWLPGRAFALKGLCAGLPLGLVALAAAIGLFGRESGWAAWPEGAAWLILITAVASFLGMNFTGSSTYTSLSGVKKEMARWVPLQIAAGGVGLALWLVAGIAG